MAAGSRAANGVLCGFFGLWGLVFMIWEPKVVALAMVFRKGRRLERKKMYLREDEEEEESFLNKEGDDKNSKWRERIGRGRPRPWGSK